MIKINLVSEAPAAAAKKPKGPEISLGKNQGDIILLICLVLFGALAGGYYLKIKGDRDALKAEEREKKQERDSLQQFIDKVEELEAQRARLKRKVDVINQLKANQSGPVRIMDETSRALPDLVWLTQLNLKGTSLTISGMAMDENAVANYISNIDSSPYFQEPSLTNLQRSGDDTFQFTLQCVFTYRPPKIEGEGEG